MVAAFGAAGGGGAEVIGADGAEAFAEAAAMACGMEEGCERWCEEAEEQGDGEAVERKEEEGFGEGRIADDGALVVISNHVFG